VIIKHVLMGTITEACIHNQLMLLMWSKDIKCSCPTGRVWH